MQSSTISLNPFSLMMEPEMVLQAMERSDALRSLRHEVFHPLDKPMRGNADNNDLAAYDAAIEQSADGAFIGPADEDDEDLMSDPPPRLI